MATHLPKNEFISSASHVDAGSAAVNSSPPLQTAAAIDWKEFYAAVTDERIVLIDPVWADPPPLFLRQGGDR